MKKRIGIIITGLALGLLISFGVWQNQEVTAISQSLYWGSKGPNVVQLQQKLKDWGFYRGKADGVYGADTFAAVKKFQQRKGIKADGVAGPGTLKALGLWTAETRTTARKPGTSRGVSNRGDITLLARVIQGEAGAEPYIGKVAVGAVILNRTESGKFPDSLNGVIFQPLAFESVSNGLVWRHTPSADSLKAAQDAINGYDPTQGALFFWNPAKPVSRWIWSRTISTRIGKHVFGN
ncbi:MAG: spore cortex-lytic enzyme [Clostridia bacterium]|nr:spore cortex-lytic enzyme [Clostridia bacterium]